MIQILSLPVHSNSGSAGFFKARRSLGLAEAGVLGLVLVILAATGTVQAQDSSEREYAVKAAYLYKLISFVDWPEEVLEASGGPFIIGVLWDSPLAEVLKSTMKGKTARGRPIQVLEFKDLRRSIACHLLFMGKRYRDNERLLSDHVGSPGLLTVGDREEFIGDGGIINFYRQEDTLRLEISPDNASRADLRISSKLLRIMRIVR